MEILENHSLKNLNTFGIDAKARFFVEVESRQDVVDALEFARKNSLPILVLGGGSNVLISDKGFDGLVILNKIHGSRIMDHGSITVGAGENWDDVVKLAVENNLAG